MSAEPLLLVGAGGFGRETAELVRAVNAAADRPRWDLLGYLDDDRSRHGETISGAPVVGGLADLERFSDARLVLCTGHPGNYGSKRRIAERLGLPPERYATLVHPAAVIPESCVLGPGTVVMAGVVATVDVRVGEHNGIMPQVVLTHDDHLEDYVTVGAGVRLAGGVHVRAGAYLGSGCLIRENRTIGAGSLIGMGAVVTRDVPDGEVWAGVPARHVRAA